MKRLFPLLLFLIALHSPAQTTQILGTNISYATGGTITGKFCVSPTDGSGNPINITTPSGQGLAGNVPTCFAIVNGTLASNAIVPDVSLSNPVNFCYRTTIYDLSGGPVLNTYPCLQPSGETWNFNTFVPAALPLAYQLPQFYTNGVLNSTQLRLNLQGDSTISLTPSGGGNVQLHVTGGGGQGISWQGDWSSSTAYTAGQAVAYQGSSYYAIQASTNIVPTNTAYWGLLAQAGATGAQGPPGSGNISEGAAYQLLTYPSAGTSAGPASLYALTPSMTQSQINALFAGLSGSNTVLIPAGTPQALYATNGQVPYDLRLGASWFQMPGVACDARSTAQAISITSGSNTSNVGSLFSAADIGKTFFFYAGNSYTYGSTASVWTPTLTAYSYPNATWSSNAPFSTDGFFYYGTDNLSTIETAMTQASSSFPLTIPTGCLLLVNGTIPWNNNQVIVGRSKGAGGFVGRPGTDVISTVDASGNSVSSAGTGLAGFSVWNSTEVDWTQGYKLYAGDGTLTTMTPVYRPAYDHTSLANDPLAPGWITGGVNGVASTTQNSAVICTPTSMAAPVVGQAIMFPYFPSIFTSTVSSTAGSCSGGFTARTMAAALPNASTYTVAQAEWFTGSAIQSTTTTIPATGITYPLTLTLTLPINPIPGWPSDVAQHGHIAVCGIEMDYMGASFTTPYTLIARRGPTTSAGCSGTTPIAPLNPCPAKNLFGSSSDQPWPVTPTINSGDSTPSSANWFPGECIGNAAIAFPQADGNTYVGTGLSGGFLDDLNLQGTAFGGTGNANSAAGIYAAGNNAPFGSHIDNIFAINLQYDYTQGPASSGQHGVAAVGPTGFGNTFHNLWFFGAFPLAFVDFQGSNVTEMNMNSTEMSPYDGTAVGSATCLQVGYTLDEQTGAGVTGSAFDHFDTYGCEPENGSHIEVLNAVDVQGSNISFDTANFEGIPNLFGGSSLSLKNSQLSLPTIDYGTNNDFGTVNGTTLSYNTNVWDANHQFLEWGIGGRCMLTQGNGPPVACGASLVQGYTGRSISSSVTGTKEVNPEGGKITPGEWNTNGSLDASPMSIANVVDPTEPFWGRYAGCNLGSTAQCRIESFDGFGGYIYIGSNQRIADQPYMMQMDLMSASATGQVTVVVGAFDSGSGQCTSSGTLATGTFNTATSWNSPRQPFQLPVDFTGHAGCILQVQFSGATTTDQYRVGYLNFVPQPSQDLGSAAPAGTETVTFSSTPTFSNTLGTSRIVLTGNISSFTLAAGIDGQEKCLNFVQGSGAYTVAPPSNVKGFLNVGTSNGLRNFQCYRYSVADSSWIAVSPGVANE